MYLNVYEDGLTHINIYSKGQCKIGRELSNMFPYTFTYKGIEFKSVEHAWHYYKIKKFFPDVAEKILNSNNAFEAKKIASTYNKFTEISAYVITEEFRDTIREVIEARIASDISLKNRIGKTYLPFTHYLVRNDVIQDCTDNYKWLVDILENIRNKYMFEYLDNLLLKYGDKCYNKRTAPSNAVYVGRGSKSISNFAITYGNPFVAEKTNKELFHTNVGKAVLMYRSHLIKEIQKNPKAWYKALQEIKNTNLQCFCNNGTQSRATGGGFCHSLILANFADNIEEIIKLV